MPSAVIYNTKKFILFSFRILAVVVAIYAVAYLLYFFSESNTVLVQADPVQAVELIQELEEWIPELPVRLIIPAINIDAEVQLIGLTEDGTKQMEVPDNFTSVGWYKHGPRPGMAGSAVIAGHYNGKNTPQAVFYDLDTLEVGDEVVIMSAERIEDIFYVVKIETYDYDSPTNDIFISTDGKKRLNLITCGGTWLPEVKLYNKRTVVYTELLTDVE